MQIFIPPSSRQADIAVWSSAKLGRKRSIRRRQHVRTGKGRRHRLWPGMKTTKATERKEGTRRWHHQTIFQQSRTRRRYAKGSMSCKQQGLKIGGGRRSFASPMQARPWGALLCIHGVGMDCHDSLCINRVSGRVTTEQDRTDQMCHGGICGWAIGHDALDCIGAMLLSHSICRSLVLSTPTGKNAPSKSETADRLLQRQFALRIITMLHCRIALMEIHVGKMPPKRRSAGLTSLDAYQRLVSCRMRGILDNQRRPRTSRSVWAMSAWQVSPLLGPDSEMNLSRPFKMRKKPNF